MRHGLNNDLGFSPVEGAENIHSVDEGFHEIHVEADLETCEERDPKGFYKNARADEIADLTGVSAPYEAPDDAQLVVDTGNYSVEECVQFVTEYIQQNFALDKIQAWA